MNSSKETLCPIHKVPLVIAQQKLDIFFPTIYAITGKCPHCRTVYVLNQIKFFSRFTYHGTQYQCLLPPLQSPMPSASQTKKEPAPSRTKSSNKKTPDHTSSPIKKSSQSTVSQKTSHPSPAKNAQQSTSTVNSTASTNQSTEPFRFTPCTTIYVMQRIGSSFCPICKIKHNRQSKTFSPKRLSLHASNQPRSKNIPVVGYECLSCHSYFISAGNAEKYFLEDHIENLNLDYYTPPKRPRSSKNDQSGQKSCDWVDIELLSYLDTLSHVCLTHNYPLKLTSWKLTGLSDSLSNEFVGAYCPKCHVLYVCGISKELKAYLIHNCNPLNKISIQCLDKKQYSRPIPVRKIISADSPTTDTIENNSSVVSSETSRDLPVSPNSDLEIENNSSVISDPAKDLPASPNSDLEIAAVRVRIDDAEKIVRIVKKVPFGHSTTNTAGEMLIRASELLGRELLGRIAHGKLKPFSAKNQKINIHKYIIWPGEEFNLYGFTKFCHTEKPEDIIVMSQKNLDHLDTELSMVTALVFCANRSEPVYLDVYYSKQSQQYFINEESYRLYVSKYGVPYLRVYSDMSDTSFEYSSLRQFSELNLYGYNVSKTAGLTTSDRQKLLQQLLDNSLLSKVQIVNHLEWLIHTHLYHSTMEDACSCWQEDLRFVHQYKINDQRLIWGKFVYGRQALRR